MNNIVTFFRNRDEDVGESYQFILKTERSVRYCFVYIRTKVLSTEFVDRTYQKITNEQINGLLNAINACGGGALVIATREQGRVKFEIRQVSGGKSELPLNCWLLTSGFPARAMAIAGAQEIPEGSHVIVPVDAEAEVRLQELMGHLAWLSPDLEAIVLNAIRRPSLDARLKEVENRVLGHAGDKPLITVDGNGWRSKAKRLWARAMTPAYSLVSLILLIILVGFDGYQVYRGKPATSATDTSGTVQTGTVTETGSNAVTASTSSTDGNTTVGTTDNAETALITDTRTLLAKLKQKYDSDGDLRTLYDTHFGQPNPSSLKAQEIAALYRQWDSKDKDKKANRPFLWGLIKLQILKHRSKPSGLDLRTWDAFGSTKNVYDHIDDKEKDDTEKRLIATLSCRSGKDDFLGTRIKCEETSDQDILKGLKPLIDFVNDKQ